LNYNEETCDPGANSANTGSSDLDRILQTFAFQESGGDPTSRAKGSSASGKYGFLSSAAQPTWQNIGGQFYPPSRQWQHAYQAPEAVQDAVMYLWYTDQYKTYEGDVFKMAVSHFYPKALSEP